MAVMLVKNSNIQDVYCIFCAENFSLHEKCRGHTIGRTASNGESKTWIYVVCFRDKSKDPGHQRRIKLERLLSRGSVQGGQILQKKKTLYFEH